ncbi:MAG: DUF6510 family protein [Vicinamibacterales bacterium]
METETDDPAREMMLDGNAVAGELMEMFGTEMTANDAECGTCGQTHAVGALLAFTHAPGLVLRCPSCEAVVVRVVRTPRGVYLDARGAAYLRLKA